MLSDFWRKRSFKFRLTLWYAAITAATLALFSVLAYEIVEHRLRTELDRQLRIDLDLVEGTLDITADGGMNWNVRGAHGDEGFARLAAWFEVWSEDGQLLLRRWPIEEARIARSLPAPDAAGLRFYGEQLEPGLHVRIMERPIRVRESRVVMRLYRDESAMRTALTQISEVLIISLPFAVLLACLGGYLVARRSLRPIALMADHARTVTSESLSARLPNPNPADEFGQLATVFNLTLQRLEDSFAELKQFAADASHELRTPLTALRTVGEVCLRQHQDPAMLREAIGSMLEEADRLHGLIDSLLVLARLDGGHDAQSRESVVLHSFLQEIVDELGLLATEKGQRIVVASNADLQIRTDPRLLRQALLNIVHNALRYSPAGADIRLSAMRHEHFVVLSVSDRGYGIAPEHLARVFDRFYRVDAARSRAQGGYGLGLAIAKRSVERLGGRIDLDSTPGEGSTFRILLPT